MSVDYGSLELLDPVNADSGCNPRMRHYAHPTEPEKTWCGMKRPYKPIGEVSVHNRVAECVVCEDLWRTFGTLGWLAQAGRL